MKGTNPMRKSTRRMVDQLAAHMQPSEFEDVALAILCAAENNNGTGIETLLKAVLRYTRVDDIHS